MSVLELLLEPEILFVGTHHRMVGSNLTAMELDPMVMFVLLAVGLLETIPALTASLSHAILGSVLCLWRNSGLSSTAFALPGLRVSGVFPSNRTPVGHHPPE